MARPKKIDAIEEPNTPLPGETVVSEVKAEAKEVNKSVSISKVYAYCRIHGGYRIDVNVDGEDKKVILKSANEIKKAADNTFIFTLKNDAYGITELTSEIAALCLEQIKGTKAYKKGFIFFADNRAEGDAKAKEYLLQQPKTGFEQLGEEDLKKSGLSKFDEAEG